MRIIDHSGELARLYYNGTKTDKPKYRLAEACCIDVLARNPNDPVANYIYGLLYLYGHGIRKNIELAQSYFLNALNNDHPHARLALLRAKVLQLFKNDKSPDAWSELAESYMLSSAEDSSDCLNALCCFQEAIRINPHHRAANFNLGKIYLYGWGIDVDIESAKRFFAAANAQGCGDSQTILVFIDELACASKAEAIVKWYDRGSWCWEQEKYQEAKFCFEQVIKLDSNHVHANYKLGLFYFSINKEYSKAGIYFDKSDKNGHPEAKNMSIRTRLYAKYRIPNFKQWNDEGRLFWGNKEYDQARYCFEESLRLNPQYANANSNLGCVYFYGCGADRNLQEARRYFEVAKAHGSEHACEKLVKIRMYLEKDRPTADDWYRLASEYYSNDPACDEVLICLTEANYLDDKHPDVNYLLGCILYYGHGRDRDFHNAKRYFLVAAESGLVKAQSMYQMAELCSNNINDGPNVWYQRGVSYHQDGVAQLASHCFEMAASQNHTYAKLMHLQVMLGEHFNDHAKAEEILSPYFSYEQGDICLTENRKKVLENHIKQIISRNSRVILSLDIDDTIIFGQSRPEDIKVNLKLVDYIADLLQKYGVQNFEFQIVTARKPDVSQQLLRIHVNIAEAQSAFFRALRNQLRSIGVDNFEDRHPMVPDEHVYCLGALGGKYTQLRYMNVTKVVFHQELTGDALDAHIQNQRARFAEDYQVDFASIKVRRLNAAECQYLNKQQVMRDILTADRFFRTIHFDDRCEHVVEVEGVEQTIGVPVWSLCEVNQSKIIDWLVSDIKNACLRPREEITPRSAARFFSPSQPAFEDGGAAYAPGSQQAFEDSGAAYAPGVVL